MVRLLLGCCAAVALSGCDIRQQFIGTRIADACNGAWNVCDTTVGCFLGDRSYIEGRFPGAAKVGIQIFEQEAGLDLDGDFPVAVPYFMKEIIEELTIAARKSKHLDHQSGVSARFSIANYRAMVASAA